jgi:hypothetical protein
LRKSLFLLVLLIGCGDPQEGAKPTPKKDASADDVRDSGVDDDNGREDAGQKPQMMTEVKCGSTACSPKAVCNDSGKTPKCECMDGYEGDGKTCKNVDECEKDHGGCSENATCTDTEGGFDCVCNNGFSGDGIDCEGLDECADEALNTCDPNATCSDTGSGFECECAEHFSGDGFGCGDVDECAKPSTFTCDDHASCHNTFGSYGCTCDPGYDGNGKTCTDLCESKSCDGHVLCQVLEDEAACSSDTCAVGYVGDGTNCTAVEDGECETCDGKGGDDVAGAVCTGTPGSGTCDCGPGYMGDGSACEDADECAADNGGCGDDQNNRCTNLPGGFFCDCQPGYEKNDQGECVDIDECDAERSPCHPNAKCTNKTPEENEQGYECKCQAGFEGDGTVCKDVNECEDGTDNCLDDGTASCVNTNGGFECRCKRGYAGDGVKSCKNVDECDDADLNDCNKNATCADKTPDENPKGYECTCKDGYTGDGKTCKDVDECKNAALYECPTNASCFNDVGGYHCGCESGKDLIESDSGSCYCDLSGYWAMRQKVDTCWEAVKVANQTVISAGDLKSTVWELHKYSYDGTKIVVEKKGCNTNKDIVFKGTSLVGNEKYASWVPDSAYFDLAFAAGATVEEPDIAPGSMFTTPPEAALAGIKLGDDPVNADWPDDYTDIKPADSDEFPRWEDTDGDGEPGFTLWSRVPGTPDPQPSPPQGGNGYSYLPVNNTRTRRATCVSQALRVVTENVTDVESCTRMSGTVHNLKSEGHIGSCMAITDDNEGDDYACNADDWVESTDSTTTRCTAAQVEFLDGQSESGQAPNGPHCGGDLATATFELVKIGGLDDDVGCEDVIEALPAESPY